MELKIDKLAMISSFFREQVQLRTKKNSWSIFSSKKNSRRMEKDEFCIEENVIFR